MILFWSGCIGSLVLYLCTMAQGVVWGDSAKLTLYSMAATPQWGSVGGHPLHTLAGMGLLQLLPGSDPAFLINFLSALMAAFSVGLAGLITRELTHQRLAPWLAMTALAFSHTFWSLAVVAESYTMAIAAGAAITLLLLQGRGTAALAKPLLAGLISGLSVGINALTMLALPGFLHLQLHPARGTSLKRFGLRLGAFAIGLVLGLVALKLLAIGISARFVTPGNALSDVTGASQEFIRGFDLRKLVMFVPNALYQFPWLLPLLALALWQRHRWQPSAWLKQRTWPEWSLLIAAGSVFLFASTYQYQRHFVFLAYPFFFFAILLGCWLAPVLASVGRPAMRVALLAMIPLINVPVYSALHRIPGAAAAVRSRDLPGRGASFFFEPWKHRLDPSAQAWGDAWIRGLPPNAVVLADFTPARVLSYCRLHTNRPDVTILETDRFLLTASGYDPEGFQQLLDQQLNSGRPVFLGDSHPDYYFLSELRRRYHLKPYNSGFRVLRSTSAS